MRKREHETERERKRKRDRHRALCPERAREVCCGAKERNEKDITLGFRNYAC